MCQSLLYNGAHIHIKDKYNKTALDYATEKNHKDIQILLLSRAAGLS